MAAREPRDAALSPDAFGRKFPASVTVTLSSGHVYKSSVTDDEARDVIRRLGELAVADTPGGELPRREGSAGE